MMERGSRLTPDYNKLEKKQAKKDGATLVRNSGRGVEKGDAKLGQFLIDYKFNAKSFQLGLENWKKMKKDAWGNGMRSPVISIVFEDKTQVAIVEWEWFMELIELTKDDDEG